MFLPLAAGVVAIAPAAARLVSRFGPAPTLIAGPLVFAGGLVYLSRLPVHGAYLSDILPGLAMIAVGAGLGFVSIINAATGGVPRSNAGVAAGLVNTMQRVGSAVGLAVLTAVATARTRALAGRLPPRGTRSSPWWAATTARSQSRPASRPPPACSAWPPRGPGAASARPAQITRPRLLAYRPPARPEPRL